jgi:hypothetical protein
MTLVSVALFISIVPIGVIAGVYKLSHGQIRSMKSKWTAQYGNPQFNVTDCNFITLPAASDGKKAHTGIVGIADRSIIFHAIENNLKLNIPIEHIRWIGQQWRLRGQKPPKNMHQIGVHVEDQGHWNIYMFSTRDYETMGRVLSDLTGLPLQDQYLSMMETFTLVVQATRMNQDVYGQWQEGQRGDLYVASEWLLFDWTEVIPIKDIRHVAVYESGHLPDLVSVDLLRLDYVVGDQMQTVGFLLSNARHLGERLAGTSLVVYEGRKKKQEI